MSTTPLLTCEGISQEGVCWTYQWLIIIYIDLLKAFNLLMHDFGHLYSLLNESYLSNIVVVFIVHIYEF